VDRLGLERLEALHHRLVGADGQLDLRIGRKREGGELVGADDVDLVAHGFQLGHHLGEGPNHAVDLRFPSICGE
jgi:hypothetical protein